MHAGVLASRSIVIAFASRSPGPLLAKCLDNGNLSSWLVDTRVLSHRLTGFGRSSVLNTGIFRMSYHMRVLEQMMTRFRHSMEGWQHKTCVRRLTCISSMAVFLYETINSLYHRAISSAHRHVYIYKTKKRSIFQFLCENLPDDDSRTGRIVDDERNVRGMLFNNSASVLIATVGNNQHLSGPMQELGSGYKRTWEPSRSRSGDACCMAARIVFTVFVFGNCNLMCKYKVSRHNNPACALIVETPAYTSTDRSSRTSLLLSLFLCISCIMQPT